VKGAPEIVFDYCTKMLNEEGEVVDLSKEEKKKILSSVVTNKFASKALRTILLAYTDLTYSEYTQLKEENNLF